MNKSYQVRIKIYDAMGVMPTRYTRWYQTWESANRRDDKLRQRYYGNNGRGRVTEEYRELK